MDTSVIFQKRLCEHDNFHINLDIWTRLCICVLTIDNNKHVYSHIFDYQFLCISTIICTAI